MAEEIYVENPKEKDCRHVGSIRRRHLQTSADLDGESTEKWLGFNKYKKLIYGLYVSYASLSSEDVQCEILRESIFGGEGKIIHRFDLDQNDAKLRIAGAVSVSGEFICIIYLAWQDYQMGQGLVNSVYLFNVTNRSFDKFKVILPRNFLQVGDDYNMMQATSKIHRSVGWILCLPCKKRNRSDMLKFYHLDFNEPEKCCDLKLLSQLVLNSAFLFSYPVVITYKQIFVFLRDTTHVYDIDKDVWSVRSSIIPVMGRGEFPHFAVSEDGRRKFAAILRVEAAVAKYCIREFMVGYGVVPTVFNLHFCDSTHYGYISDIMATNDVIFMYNGLSREGICVHFNVLSLQDIAMKRIRPRFYPKGCSGQRSPLLSFNDALDTLKAPTLMKRKYVGDPTVVWNILKICTIV